VKYLRVPQNDAGPNGPEGYAALRVGAATVDHPNRSLLRLRGKDPTGMLNAVLTNDVPAQDDRGAYALLLDPKGRVQTDLRAVKTGDEVLIDTEPEGAKAAAEILGRYAPFSRVKLDRPPSWRILGLYGPRASEMPKLPHLDEHETKQVEIEGIPVLLVGVFVPVVGYDLIAPSDALDEIRELLIGRGAVPANNAAYETARIAAGIPRFGTDVTPDNFPGESKNILERAVSFGKGCYPGQETVARMHYRGSPNKRLYRFEMEPGHEKAPEAGDEILQGGEAPVDPDSPANSVGWVTSVAPYAVDGKNYALGFLARKADPEAPMRAQDTQVLAAMQV
jgi:folate-binding protein YgfZ